LETLGGANQMSYKALGGWLEAFDPSYARINSNIHILTSI